MTDSAFDLSGRIVHMRLIRTAGDGVNEESFSQFLSEEERLRAARFRVEGARRSFIVARGALRMLLSRYLGAPPMCISFEYGVNGKPRLAGPSPVRFNASHSGDLALFAFTGNCEVGIDVERIRPMPDLRGIATRFFCRAEAEELMSVPEQLRERAFFHCWTRKEAYIKATGEGLSAELDSFQVSLEPGAAARFIHINSQPVEGVWTLQDLPVPATYVAALAYRDAPRELRVFEIDDLQK